MDRLPEQDGRIPEGKMSLTPFIADKIINNSEISFNGKIRE